MESIQTKIIQKSLQKMIYIPKMIQFDFPEFNNLTPLEKLAFIEKHNLLSYNSHRLIRIEDLKSIFGEINSLIEKEVGRGEESVWTEENITILDSLNRFLSELAEERFYLNFKQFENLVELLERFEDFKLVSIVLQIFTNIFSIRTRYCEELLLNVSDRVKIKFLVLLNCWFLNFNLANKISTQIHEITEDLNLDNFTFFDFSQFPNLFFDPISEEFVQTDNNIKNIDVVKNLSINLVDYLHLDSQKLILEKIQVNIGLKIEENSTVNMILKMRIAILKNMYDFQNKRFIPEKKLFMIFCGISSNLILDQTKKIKDLKEKQLKIIDIFDFRFYEEHKAFPIKKFSKIFKIADSEDTQLRTLTVLFSYYDSIELKKDSYIDFESFLNKVLINLNRGIMQREGVLQEIEEKSYLDVCVTDRITSKVLHMMWRFLEEDIEGVVSTRYSGMIDTVLNISRVNNAQLQNNYDEQKIFNLLKVIILIKNEIHKDKEIVFLDILIDLFDQHISLYNRYYDKIQNFPNVINIYIQLLFELIEALFFYFIDPAKPNLIHSIPRISREILENKIWTNPSIYELLRNKKDSGFLQVFNVMISFINDLLNEIPENLIAPILTNFHDIGLIDLIHEEFLVNQIPSDFDLMSFYVKFLTMIYLHKNEILPQHKFHQYLTRIFELLFNKELVCKNIRRFLSAYVNETIKNLGEELVILSNSIPQVNDFLLRKIYEVEIKITDLENYVVTGLIRAKDEKELIGYFRDNKHFCQELGWFRYNDKSNTEDLYDDFYLMQKNIYNLWKLFGRFFDNHRTNFYKQFFDSEIANENKNIFDFIFKRKIIHLNEISKIRKFHMIFAKSLIITNNIHSRAKFLVYLREILLETSDSLKTIFDASSKEELRHAAYFLNYYNFQNSKQEFDLNISSLTSNTYNLINLYMRIFCIADCLRYQISSNYDESFFVFYSQEDNFKQFVVYYKNMSIFVNNLFEQTQDFYYESLFAKMDSILAENYILNLKVANHINMNNIFMTIQSNCVLGISSINKELFFLIFAKLKHLKKNLFYKDFFESHNFSAKLENLLKNKPDEFGIVHLNSLFNQYIYLLLNNDSEEYKEFINCSFYNLCKKKFFSKLFVDSVSFVLAFINEKSKYIRKLIIKKENPDCFFNIEEISIIYLFDENLTVLLKNKIKFLQKLFSFTTISYFEDFENEQVSQLKVKEIIENEKYQMIKNLSQVLKNLPQNCLHNLAFLERKAYLKENKKNRKSAKEEKEIKEMGVKVDKMDILKAFLETYRNFFDFSFSCLIPNKFEVKVGMVPANEGLKDWMQVNMRLMDNLTNEAPALFTKNLEKPNTVDPPDPAQKQETEITDRNSDKLRKELMDDLEINCRYFFANFLRYKEIYKSLVAFWGKFGELENESKKGTNRLGTELTEAALQAVKTTSGIKEKRADSNWLIETKDPRDALYYLLKLLNQLKIQFKINIEEKGKHKKTDLNFLLNLLEDIFTKKYNLKRVQDPIYAIIELLFSLDFKQVPKVQVLAIIDKLLAQHKSLSTKVKEKTYLINAKILVGIFELLAKLMNQDEKFIEKMISFNDKNFLRNLLRIEIKDLPKNNTKELFVHFRTFVENIVRHPHVIRILYESEIKNFFFQKTEGVFLRSFTQVFEKYIDNCENIFMFETKNFCDITPFESIKNEEDKFKIAMKPKESPTVKNYEVKNFIHEFLFSLIKDLIFKLNKRTNKNEHFFVFTDLFLSDIIFFQLFPRYPMFYLIKTKEKISFTKFFFEKILTLHWGYLSFLEPLCYDSHFLVENEKKEILSVTDFLQDKINLSVLEILDLVEKEMSAKNLDFQKLMNINVYILNLLAFGNSINKFKNFFIEVLAKLEKITILICEGKLMSDEYLLANLGVSETLRRLQIIELMNKTLMEEISQKANNSSYLIVPQTFSLSLKKWTQLTKANPDSVFMVKTKNNVDYTNFNYLLCEEGKKQKDKIRIYFRNELSEMPSGFRNRIINILPEEFGRRGRDFSISEMEILHSHTRPDVEIMEDSEDESENLSNPEGDPEDEEDHEQNDFFRPVPELRFQADQFEEEPEEDEEDEEAEIFQDYMQIEEFNEAPAEPNHVDYQDNVIEDEFTNTSEAEEDDEEDIDEMNEEEIDEDDIEEDSDEDDIEEDEDDDEYDDGFIAEEDYDDEDLSNLEDGNVSRSSRVFQSRNYLLNVKEEFFSKKLFEKYPFALPLNTNNTVYVFYKDQINASYQIFITNKFLKFFRKKQDEFYLKCEKDFSEFDFKQWDNKFIADLKKQKSQTNLLAENENNLIRDNIPRRGMMARRTGGGGGYLTQYFDIVNRRLNNNSTERKENEDNKKFNLYEELTKPTHEEKNNSQNNLISDIDNKNKMEIENLDNNENNQTNNNNENNQTNNNNTNNNNQQIQPNLIEIDRNTEQTMFILEQIQNEIMNSNLNIEFRNINDLANNMNIFMQNSLTNPHNEMIDQELGENTDTVNENENSVNIMNEENGEEEFDFGTLGLPDNFLEIAEIDPTFFYALPPDLQAELAIQHGEALNIRTQARARTPSRPQGEQQQQPENGAPQNAEVPVDNNQENNSVSLQDNLMETANNNMIFLSSLAPDIREEVLMTCPDEFLLSLSQEIQDEARRLRTARIINNDFYISNQMRTHSQQNNVENRLKKSLEANKQKDLINKIFPVKTFDIDPRLLGIFDNIKNREFNLNDLSVSYLSVLLFNEETQTAFYQQLFSDHTGEILNRYLTVVEKLTSSNYQFFHQKENFDKLLEVLMKHQKESGIVFSILKILVHVTQTSVTFTKKKPACGILITKRNLQCLTSTNYIKSTNIPISEYLSRILMILSFNKDNLKTIIDNLKDNISAFGFNLNMNLDAVLKIKEDKENYIDAISKIANDSYETYMKFLKLVKLVEQLFTKSFNLNLEDEQKNNQEKKKEIEDDKFEKIKEKVMSEFSNYFDDSTIKNVFAKLFQIVFIFEKDIDELLKRKTFSKPIFFQFLPLIEAFFICYKILCDDETFQHIKKKYKFKKQKEIQISKYKDKIESEEDSQTEKELFAKEEDLDIESIFYRACKKNKKVLNYMMGKLPRLSDSSLRIIIKKAPKIISFDLKRKYFSQKINELKIHHTMRLKIRRDNLFTDSFTQIISKNAIDLRMKMHVKFVDEEGEDAGGLTRAWFEQLSKEIFNPDYVLFKPAAHGYAFQPNPNSSVHLEHLKYFKFIGRIVGKALFEGQLLDAHFTTSFYKHMVGASLSYLDFQDYDPAYFKTLKWILENDVTCLDLNFCYETDHFGKTILKPLKENGEHILVDNQNKEEYIKLLCYAKMADEIKPQIEAFLEGLNDVVPAELIKIFTAQELELMISGLPEIDIEDLRKNTEYTNYTKDSLVIQNFWKVLKNFDQNLKAGFLQFVTGTSKVPLEGFSHLKGIGGEIQKFNIHRAYDKNKLPTSHTCMNQLDLPEYETLEDLEKKLKTAIIFGKEGFGFL